MMDYHVKPRFVRRAMQQYKDAAFRKMTEKNISSFRKENTATYLSALSNDANRIENGTFTLGGKTYTLPKNDAGFNNHHSGPDGFERRIFDVTCEEDGNEVRMELTSPDGDEGFPGNMKVCLTYTFSDDCALTYHITAVSDADTVANMTNHS